jgi:hypothetical protein
VCIYIGYNCSMYGLSMILTYYRQGWRCSEGPIIRDLLLNKIKHAQSANISHIKVRLVL